VYGLNISSGDNVRGHLSPAALHLLLVWTAEYSPRLAPYTTVSSS
jgi:hypothetical protein